MVYWEESCVIFTPPLSSLPPRVISSLLPIFLQLSCLARCFIRSENPLNFLRKFANLINDGAKILTLHDKKEDDGLRKKTVLSSGVFTLGTF